MVEQADTRDLKSLGSDIVPVQVRLAAPINFTVSDSKVYFFYVNIKFFDKNKNINKQSKDLPK